MLLFPKLEGFPEVLAAGELELFFDEQSDVGRQISLFVGIDGGVGVRRFWAFSDGLEVEVPGNIFPMNRVRMGSWKKFMFCTLQRVAKADTKAKRAKRKPRTLKIEQIYIRKEDKC